jgi:hypothetical protein
MSTVDRFGLALAGAMVSAIVLAMQACAATTGARCDERAALEWMWPLLVMMR